VHHTGGDATAGVKAMEIHGQAAMVNAHGQVAMDADVAVEARPPRRRLWHHTGGNATAGVQEIKIHGQVNAHG